MNRNIKTSKVILLTAIFLTMAVFASACATDGGYAAVQGGAGALGELGVNTIGNDTTAEVPDVHIEDDELIYDHDAIFDTDEHEEDGMIENFPYYFSVAGTIKSIEKTEFGLQVTIEDTYGNPAVLIITENTVYPFESEVSVGDTVTAWYATNMPMILIWPPQYDVAVLAVNAPSDININVDRFVSWEDGMMLSQDEMFAFRVDENTEIVLADGTDFTGGDLEGRNIIVIYGISTRSIPEQATATKLIVLFEDIMPLG